MPGSPRSLRLGAALSALVSGLVLGLGVPATAGAVDAPAPPGPGATASGPDQGSSAGSASGDDDTSRADAQADLDHVRSVFDGLDLTLTPHAQALQDSAPAAPPQPAPTGGSGGSGDRDGDGSGGADDTGTQGSTDVTSALLDLGDEIDALPPAERAEADSYYSRPVLAQELCSSQVCVHYTTTGTNAATAAYARSVLDTFDHVRATYAGAGYRSPLSDGTAGGGPESDVYLQDVGLKHYYGYCTTDQRDTAQTSAYCVVDNDFSHAEFPRHTPTQNLQVTAAHEYFHAVQFAYNALADSWFMEGTATWAEDELYTSINDNRQYLPDSPMGRPRESMDQFDVHGTFQYGTWIFFRYLTEHFGAVQGTLPIIVRDLWQDVDATPGAPHLYSLPAIKHELARRDTTLTQQFASFSVANRMPGRSYSEGTAYPQAPLVRTLSVQRAHRFHQSVALRLNHLASATVRYVPTASLSGRWRLRMRLHLAPTASGSAVMVTTGAKGHPPTSRRIHLSAQGVGATTVDFSRSRTPWVEVGLVNAGTAYDCGHDTRFTCGGRSLDDQEPVSVDASALRG